MKRQIEILAPAGSYEGMRAAMNAGCDAIYIGGSSFGARAYANNLDEAALLQAIDEAHIRGKKLYLTVNTLLKEKEHAKQLYSYLEKYYLQGLDAAIVQDVGVLHFIHEQFPGLPVHASTQMTLTMAEGANLLKEYGVTRLVTSRELDLEEIRSIRENTSLEIETFVHGALCYCYSGQCLMSSMIGGRSGNRGRCAQPCRMPYQLWDDYGRLSGEQEKYLLSPKDINTLAIIPELVEAGIDSFKIEGRMKRPEYSAATARLYRKYVDYYLDKGKAAYDKLVSGEEFREDMLQLQDIYNRGGFSEGYARTYHGKSMMSLYRPNHGGVFVGEVKEVQGSQVGILLKERLNAQDILEIRVGHEAVHEFTVKEPHEAGVILRTTAGKRPSPAAEVKKTPNYGQMKAAGTRIKKGAQVYRTKNNALLEEFSREYIEKDAQRGMTGVLVAHTGDRLSLTLRCGGLSSRCGGLSSRCGGKPYESEEVEVTVFHNEAQPAIKQPMTKEKLAAALEKTGETLFYFEELSIDSDEDIFVPVAWLNELRRAGISRLQEALAGKYHRNLDGDRNLDGHQGRKQAVMSAPDGKTGAGNFGISVSVQTELQFEAAMNFLEVTAIYAEYDCFDIKALKRLARRADREIKDFYLSLPQICRKKVYGNLKQDLEELINLPELTGFILKNLEEVALLQSLLNEKMAEKQIILNYNMYTYNKEAKLFWQEHQLEHFTAPIELNYQELRELGISDCDMVVYGHLLLMVSAQCLFENTVGCARAGKNNIQGRLTDRLGKSFYVKTNCTTCYNTIYNGQPLALHKHAADIIRLNPRNIRIDFTKESFNEACQVLRLFYDRFFCSGQDVEELSDYTTGHFKRGIE
ncbi:MAG TPA: U32 family peptidase [Clostridiales bacterium]|nr:U32 family peptidase [Clostridiales bacterium]